PTENEATPRQEQQAHRLLTRAERHAGADRLHQDGRASEDNGDETEDVGTSRVISGCDDFGHRDSVNTQQSVRVKTPVSYPIMSPIWRTPALRRKSPQAGRRPTRS